MTSRRLSTRRRRVVVPDVLEKEQGIGGSSSSVSSDSGDDWKPVKAGKKRQLKKKKKKTAPRALLSSTESDLTDGSSEESGKKRAKKSKMAQSSDAEMKEKTSKDGETTKSKEPKKSVVQKPTDKKTKKQRVVVLSSDSESDGGRDKEGRTGKGRAKKSKLAESSDAEVEKKKSKELAKSKKTRKKSVEDVRKTEKEVEEEEVVTDSEDEKSLVQRPTDTKTKKQKQKTGDEAIEVDGLSGVQATEKKSDDHKKTSMDSTDSSPWILKPSEALLKFLSDLILKPSSINSHSLAPSNSFHNPLRVSQVMPFDGKYQQKAEFSGGQDLKYQMPNRALPSAIPAIELESVLHAKQPNDNSDKLALKSTDPTSNPPIVPQASGAGFPFPLSSHPTHDPFIPADLLKSLPNPLLKLLTTDAASLYYTPLRCFKVPPKKQIPITMASEVPTAPALPKVTDETRQPDELTPSSSSDPPAPNPASEPRQPVIPADASSVPKASNLTPSARSIPTAATPASSSLSPVIPADASPVQKAPIKYDRVIHRNAPPSIPHTGDVYILLNAECDEYITKIEFYVKQVEALGFKLSESDIEPVIAMSQYKKGTQSWFARFRIRNSTTNTRFTSWLRDEVRDKEINEKNKQKFGDDKTKYVFVIKYENDYEYIVSLFMFNAFVMCNPGQGNNLYYSHEKVLKVENGQNGVIVELKDFLQTEVEKAKAKMIFDGFSRDGQRKFVGIARRFGVERSFWKTTAEAME